MKIEIKHYKPIVGMSSLVGIVGKDYPLSFGNYCSIDRDGPYLVNMWAENLEEWRRRNPGVDKVEVTFFSEGVNGLGLVTDERLKDWCNIKPCVTGVGWTSRRICEAVCQRMGVSTKQWLCGCEAPEGRPNLSQRFSYEPREGTNHCHNCHREWPMDFHKNYR